MPVNSNIAIQYVPTVAWDGTTAFGFDIRKFTRFAWAFEVTADLAADAVFNVQAADPSAADNCVAGAYGPVAEVATCDATAEAAAQAQITIPAGTVAGTVCTGTVPCTPGAFMRMNHVSGGEDVRVAMVRGGPMM